MYYTSLDRWRYCCRYARKAEGHPRFITVRYEDLVLQPARTQAFLMGQIPFLKIKGEFNDFDKIARPSPQADRALRGLRPIDSDSVGAWRQHKPRLKNQIELHGSINNELIQFGYEKDDVWFSELDDIEPDNSRSFRAERVSLWTILANTAKRAVGTIRYATGTVSRKPIRRV